MRSPFLHCPALCALLALAGGRDAAAQQRNHLYDRFEAGLGVGIVSVGTGIRLDVEGEGVQAGTEIDVEEDLGLDPVEVRPRLHLAWRPWRRHQLAAIYIPGLRTGRITPDFDLVVDSVTYAAGGNLDTRIASHRVALEWSWALVARERATYGLDVGVGAIFSDLRLDGSGYVTDGSQEVQDSLAYAVDYVAPLAALSVFGHWRVGDRWYLGATLGGLTLDVADIRITEVRLGGHVRLYPMEWLALEGGFALNRQTVQAEGDAGEGPDLGFAGRLSYEIAVLRLGAVASW